MTASDRSDAADITRQKAPARGARSADGGLSAGGAGIQVLPPPSPPEGEGGSVRSGGKILIKFATC